MRLLVRLSELRHALVIAIVLVSGCTHVAYAPRDNGASRPAAATAEPGRYEVLPGGDAQAVAELRAASAPEHIELVSSQSPAGDEHLLAAKGFVHIGDGYYVGADAAARAWLLRKGREVGADQALIYAPPDAADAAAPTLHAAYYVRFRLPFGASFRDLTAAERDTLGTDGVQIGAVIGGSPAAEANLRAGDFVVAFNGEPVHDRAGFQQQLRAHMGKRVTLTITRDGAVSKRLLRLGVLASDVETRK